MLLSGDNAVVIALAVRALPRPPAPARAGLAAPSARSCCACSSWAIVSMLLRVPLLRLVGRPAADLDRLPAGPPGGGRGERGTATRPSFWESVWIIVVADITMSLDNVLAVAGAAHGDMLLVTLGIAHVGAHRGVRAAGSWPGS